MHVRTLTKLGDSWMPAVASTMEERSSVVKSVLTTASSVYLQRRATEPYKHSALLCSRFNHAQCPTLYSGCLQ